MYFYSSLCTVKLIGNEKTVPSIFSQKGQFLTSSRLCTEWLLQYHI